MFEIILKKMLFDPKKALAYLFVFFIWDTSKRHTLLQSAMQIWRSARRLLIKISRSNRREKLLHFCVERNFSALAFLDQKGIALRINSMSIYHNLWVCYRSGLNRFNPAEMILITEAQQKSN